MTIEIRKQKNGYTIYNKPQNELYVATTISNTMDIIRDILKDAIEKLENGGKRT